MTKSSRKSWVCYAAVSVVKTPTADFAKSSISPRLASDMAWLKLKNQWGFAGFCAKKAVISECAARHLLLTYNLWSLFTRVLLNRGKHTEAITSRYKLLMLPGRVTRSDRVRRVKLAVGSKLRASLPQASSLVEFNCAAVEIGRNRFAEMEPLRPRTASHPTVTTLSNCGF